MSLYLVNGMMLGSRLIGYEVYQSRLKDFIGVSEKQIKDKILSGEKIYGFVLDEKKNLLLDKEGFNMKNIQMKSGVNGLKWLYSSENELSTAFLVVKVIKKTGICSYETINTRHARIVYSEEKIRALMELGDIAGASLEKGKIKICKGVEMEEEKEREKPELEKQQ